MAVYGLLIYIGLLIAFVILNGFILPIDSTSYSINIFILLGVYFAGLIQGRTYNV